MIFNHINSARNESSPGKQVSNLIISVIGCPIDSLSTIALAGISSLGCWICSMQEPVVGKRQTNYLGAYSFQLGHPQQITEMIPQKSSL